MPAASNCTRAAAANITCVQYSASCYPCPYNSFGEDCATPYNAINGGHQLAAALIYSFCGVTVGSVFARRLWLVRQRRAGHGPGGGGTGTPCAADWRALDQVYMIAAISAFLFVPRFMLRPIIHGFASPPMIIANVLDVSITLLLVSGAIIMCVDWVEIAGAKVRRSLAIGAHTRCGPCCTVPLSPTRLLKFSSVFTMWFVVLLCTILEQSLPTPEKGDTSSDIPEAVRGGSLFDFRGVYHSGANAAKNLSHGAIGFGTAVVSTFTLLNIVRKLKQGARSLKTQALSKRLLTYCFSMNVCLAMDLGYGLATASSRMQKEWYFDFPSCSVFGEYFFAADFLKLIIYAIVLLMTRHYVLDTTKAGGPSKISHSSSVISRVSSTTPSMAPAPTDGSVASAGGDDYGGDSGGGNGGGSGQDNSGSPAGIEERRSDGMDSTTLVSSNADTEVLEASDSPYVVQVPPSEP